ncbi:hypothetical protein GCM10010297_19100 [Streptomyces malachitofuscus]|nr:hypothetical protein GCM10010297_19100 [Streptomyces malachitofuscus]
MSTEPRADCRADTGGEVTFRLRLPSATHPRLLLALRPKKGRPEQKTRTLDLEPTGDDGAFGAVLEPEPPLEEGRWDAYVLRGPDAERERLRPGLRDVRALVDGGSRDRSSPVAVRVPYTTLDGFLSLRAWRRTAHAEAGAIAIADGAMTVRVRPHGATLSAAAVALLRLRGDKDTVRDVPVRPAEDGDFTFTVDYGALVAENGGARVWNVFLRPAPGAPLIRVGRILDDLADRKGSFVYPQVTVGGSVVRPYYTVDNDLSVEVTAAG